MSQTPRLGLPFIAVGQASKEFTHNEALQALDVLVSGCVEGPPQAAPPASPAVGSAYLVASGATDVWAGKANCVAAWTSGGWRFVSPTDGLQLIDRSNGTLNIYRNGAWELGTVRATSVQIGGLQVIGARGAAIAAPSGGTVIDVQSRNAINAILAALQAHGLIAP